MITLPRLSSGSWQTSAGALTSRNSSKLGQSSTKLSDGWPLAQHFPSCTKGIVPKGQFKRCLSRHFTPLVSFASKKGGRSLKTRDLDREDLLEETNLPAKPLGFGEGKVYDTSLEDKLLEEIENENSKSADMQKKATNAKVANNIKRNSTSNDPEIGEGVKVWIGDLPKKKNIDRDLWAVFRNVPGLLDISPMVQGNEKTRDPICKGHGFLTFNTREHAKRFILSFQSQTLTFGKVEKQVRFKLLQASDAETNLFDEKSLSEKNRLRTREKRFEKVASSDFNSELASLRSVGRNVSADAIQQTASSDDNQPQVEVVDDEETAYQVDVYQGMPSEDEDDDDEFDSDYDSEFEMSVEVYNFSEPDAPRTSPGNAKNNDLIEAERRIEELERRIKLKLEDEGYGSKGDRPKANTGKAGGSNLKGSRASKQASRKGNNVAAVTHGLKGREREIMTGVLDKYGKKPIIR